MSKYDGQEKRKDTRFAASSLRIILKDDKNFRGEKIRDISLGGVFIRMDSPLPLGTPLTLTLDPKLGLGDIKLEGEVIWRSSNENDPESGIGVKFKELNPRVKEKLSKLFKTLRKA